MILTGKPKVVPRARANRLGADRRQFSNGSSVASVEHSSLAFPGGLGSRCCFGDPQCPERLKDRPEREVGSYMDELLLTSGCKAAR
jgi:hypothetical protein